MKTTADALRDVGHTVIESQLVLNLLRGLNPRFSSTADNIADSNPLPNFATAREKLILKELRLANEGQVTPQTTLLAGTPSCGTACHASMGSQGASGPGGRSGSSGGGGYRNRRKGRGGGGGSSQGGSRGPPQPAGPWFCFSPWGGQQQQWGIYQQQWRPHSGPGVLGTPPLAHIALPQHSTPTTPLLSRALVPGIRPILLLP